MWHDILKLRSLVLSPVDDIDAYVRFTSICLENNRYSLARQTLIELLGCDPQQSGVLPTRHPIVSFAFVKYLWEVGSLTPGSGLRHQAVRYLEDLVVFTRGTLARRRNSIEVSEEDLDAQIGELNGGKINKLAALNRGSGDGGGSGNVSSSSSVSGANSGDRESEAGSGSIAGGSGAGSSLLRTSTKVPMLAGWMRPPVNTIVVGHMWGSANGLGRQNVVGSPSEFLARCLRRLGDWKYDLARVGAAGPASTDATDPGEILELYYQACEQDRQWSEAWQSLGRMHYLVIADTTADVLTHRPPSPALVRHAELALKGLFHAVSLAPGNSIEDALRILQLWFRFGAFPSVAALLTEGRVTVSVDTWLQVVPQFIARLDICEPAVRPSIHQLLLDVGRAHPDAVITPLLVAQAIGGPGASMAASLLAELRHHHSVLVEQTTRFNHELNRVAILWPEAWLNTLLEASQDFYERQDVAAMVARLTALHVKTRTPQTPCEVGFAHSYGAELGEAEAWLVRFATSHDAQDVINAWNLYHRVYVQVTKALPQYANSTLDYISPWLHAAKRLPLLMPGQQSEGCANAAAAALARVTVASLAPTVKVMASKQRPRKLAMVGSDGQTYDFLLKGNEDIRVDGRVMTLFGVVNALLVGNVTTQSHRLSIKRYSITPLSQTSGLIGWVPDCDTLHMLIVRHRAREGLLLHTEHAVIRKMSPTTTDANGRQTDRGFDHLMPIQKAEVFRCAASSTKGDDLAAMLWVTSPSAETWLAKRTNFTRSPAVLVWFS
jgi:FKBP12-rapamycin complex-associated protein